MKKLISLISFLLAAVLCAALLSSCNQNPRDPWDDPGQEDNRPGDSTPSDPSTPSTGDDSSSYGEDLEELSAYAGYFDGDVAEITLTCVSGTEGCAVLDDSTHVLTISGIKENSVYAVSGQLRGSIVIDIDDAYELDLELQGLSLVSEKTNPITILGGDQVSLTAKSGYDNYIYDIRSAVDENDETAVKGAIYSTVDLKIGGKGSLFVVSEHNNGIHSKDDLQVKNLTLLVSCVDDALKGNDSVKITDGVTTLIATGGDGIKTKNSDLSKKGKQRGSVTISGGTHTIYAACDGIDAAYNVCIEEESTALTIYTDRYSNYSSEVTAVDEDRYYIRFTDKNYNYSVKYYNSEDDYCWVNAEYHSVVSGGRNNYYYFAFPKKSGYESMQFFIYSSDMSQGQDEEYVVASDYLAPHEGYDTFALTRQGSRLSYQWTNYTTSVQEGGFGGMGGMGGFGGMNDGNTDKGDHSTKGIKAGNEVLINAGTIWIKSYDDAIHANNDGTLENGETPLGNVTVGGGVVTVYSNDDGIHADGTVRITGGKICVTGSYEGLEGANVYISGGEVSVLAQDDGINGTATSGTAIEISGGMVYVYCTGDGLDSNSRTSYQGIVFSGGNTVIIANSSNNSAIDTEQGYRYTGGSVVAIMPSRGMTSEVTHCSDFSKIGSSKNISLTEGSYLTVGEGDKIICTVKMPLDMSAKVVYLGSKSVTLASASSTATTLDDNGVNWN